MSGRNSCSGGSSRRTVTGRPSIASRMPTKSDSCSFAQLLERGSLLGRASSARIMRCTIGRRSPRNMCSVRHRPMPSAPNSRGLARVLAAGRRWCAPCSVRNSSAQPRMMPNGPLGSGVITGTSPTTISPVVPLIEMTSPSLHGDAADRERARRRGRSSAASAPQIAGLPMPRATTAAWLTRPPRDVRMPSAAIMPCRSSGEVSGRTRITRSPASWRASASSAVK